ncbi:MAG: hypothetical protein EXQ91_08995 [Alphaproteobacteria bacterium]|nr:hypothetical protein [Alphaproteobacteria bacterium]
MKDVRAIVIDPNQIFRAGLSSALSSFGFSVCAEAASLAELAAIHDERINAGAIICDEEAVAVQSDPARAVDLPAR